MALRFDAGDVSGFKILFSLVIMYGLMSLLVHSIIYMKFIEPLGIDAPLDRFSEARAIEHVRVLSHEIDGRQVRPRILNFLSLLTSFMPRWAMRISIISSSYFYYYF